MNISCSTACFPALPVEDRYRLIALLGFKRVGVTVFVPEAELSAFLSNPDGLATRVAGSLEETGLLATDLFLIAPCDSISAAAPNAQEKQRRTERRRVFLAGVRCATKLEVPGISILPGVPWPGRPSEAWTTAKEELRWYCDEAGRSGLELRAEPHIGSIVPTPELTALMLEEVPGLKLALDVGHFTFQGIELGRVLPLAGATGYVHLGGAAAGALHIRLSRNEIDFAILLKSLDEAGYAGDLCVEYVPMDKWGADTTDAISAIIETREFLARHLV
jgi:sugar phosphate isomerase/epimerase